MAWGRRAAPHDEGLLGTISAAPRAWLEGCGIHVYLALCSAVLLLAAVLDSDQQCFFACHEVDTRTQLVTYSLVVGALSLALCLCVVLLSGAGSALLTPDRMGAHAVFLLLWWGAAAAVLTFMHASPFTVLGNAYFALWAGVACSVALIGETGVTSLPASVPAPPLLALLGCSVVVLAACLMQPDLSQPEVVWGICLGAFSIVLSAGTHLARDASLRLAAALLNAALWVPGAGVLTFKAPFQNANNANGFFAAWLGLLCAVAVAMKH